MPSAGTAFVQSPAKTTVGAIKALAQPELDSLEALEAAFARPRAVTRRAWTMWTRTRVENLRALRDQGFSWRAIGREMGIRHNAAYRAYQVYVQGRRESPCGYAENGSGMAAPAPALQAASGWRWTPEEDQLLLEGVKSTSNRELAALMGRSPGAVAGRLHRLRTGKVSMKKEGPIHLKKVLAEAGISQRKAAELYNKPGLSAASIVGIVNRGRWPKVRGLREHIVKVHKEKGLPHEGLFEPLGPDEVTEKEEQMLTKVYLSPQAVAHFGLRKDPFAEEPGRRDEVFADGRFKDVAAQVIDAARGQRMLAVSADVGAGKSTLLAYCKAELERASVTIIEPSFFEMDRLHAGGIVEVILRTFGQRPRATLVGRRLQVEELLAVRADAGRPVALIFDEAHRLSDKTLSSLKIFWEMREGFSRFLSIILVGQKLSDKLTGNADFRELGERCQIVELEKLDTARLTEYLKFRLRLAGGQLSELITHHAIELIAERAETPQKANNLAARVLDTAWRLAEATPIRKEVVERALRSNAPMPEPTRPRLAALPGRKE